jgi:hypothetical protein
MSAIVEHHIRVQRYNDANSRKEALSRRFPRDSGQLNGWRKAPLAIVPHVEGFDRADLRLVVLR